MSIKLPTIPGYTEADLASLTPEELSALESDQGDNLDDIKALAEGGEGGEKGADDGKGDEGKPNATGAEAETAPEGGEPAAAVKTGYVAEAPADAAEQLTTLKAAKQAAKDQDKEALKKLHDGEIDFEDYQKVKDAADTAIDEASEKISALQSVVSKAEISAEMTQQEVARAWQTEVGAMMKTGKSEGLDYAKDEALGKELDGLVKAFSVEAGARGMTDEGLAASKWALQQAHATMKMRHADKVVKPAEEPGKGKEGEANSGQRHSLTSLARMPNADRAQGDNDAISKFGDLQGEDLELAMARMTPAEVEKLMASV